MGLTVICAVFGVMTLYFWFARRHIDDQLFHLKQTYCEKQQAHAELEQEHLTLRANINEILTADKASQIFSKVPLALSSTYGFSYIWIDVADKYADKEVFEFAGGYNAKTRKSGDPLKLGFGLSHKVVGTGKAILVQNPTLKGTLDQSLLPTQVTTLLSIPLGNEKNCWGVLHLADEKEHTLSHSTLENLKLLASLVSLAVDNLRGSESLRIVESERRALNAMLSDAVVSINARGMVTSANTNFEDLFGYQISEVIGKPLSLLMPSNEAPHYAEYIENYLTTGERRFMGVAREVEGRHKNGHSIPLDITVHESNVDGRLLFTALIRDISERRDSRLLLELAEGRAQQADMARRRFLANMSHALRTPLSGIVGMADLLMETRLQSDQRDYLNNLMDSAQGLLENLDGLMECSREKDDEQADGHFDPRKLLDDLGDLLASRVRGRTVELYLHIHPDLPSRIPGQFIRINQVLLHMATHMLRGISAGSLVIGVAPLEKGRQYGIHYWVQASPCALDFNMVEALLGQPHTHILDDHNMAEGCFNLHLAHILAYLMGGSMGVSHDSDGATLTLTVPLPEPLEQGLGVSLLAQVRCLILEPKGVAALAFESLLHGYGCCPQLAEEWQEALAILGTQAANGRPFHLVIMPYSLPDNGAESFLKAVSADPNLAFTRIMVHSPMSHREKALALLAQGAVYCLTHPIKQKRLVELMLKMIKDELVADDLQETGQIGSASVQGRVLLVEDNAINQKLVIKVFEKEECEYVLAEDGQAAVEAAAREVFDLILMDINLPIMDGIQATRLIRLEGPNRKTPIIALTADVINVNEQMCRVHKMDGLLFKPIRVYELVGLMRRTFQKAQTGDGE